MWRKDSLSGHYVHNDTTKDLLPFLEAAKDKDPMPLYVLSDHLEERGHPAAKIIRSALDHGLRFSEPGKDDGWNVYTRADINHPAPRPLWFNTFHHSPSKENASWVFMASPTHSFVFHAPHSHENTDYIHSTGLPQEKD